MTDPVPDLVHRDVKTGGVRLHVVTAGPAEGPMVLLLHGFPEAWFGWRRQMGLLAARGYFVVAPDQRGYNTSDKPNPIRDYAVDRLTEDALGLATAFGRHKLSVVGHDWGGVVAWWLGLDHADRVERMCVMNMPHPKVLARSLRTRQLARFWYVALFQIPGLAEGLLPRNDFRRLSRAMTENTVHQPFSDRDLAEYRNAWAQPGALPAMLAWYRAAVRYPRRPVHDRVTVPTLMVWGAQDTALGAELVEPSLAQCDQARLVRIEDAGHFVQHDAIDRVNEALAGFFPAVG